MIHVFHIFLKSARVSKPDYTPEFRKSFQERTAVVRSELGYVQNNRLFLPDYWKGEFFAARTGGIVLTDIWGYSGREQKRELELLVKRGLLPEWYVRSQLKQKPELRSFDKQLRNWSLGMLSIEKVQEGDFDLYVNDLENHYMMNESPMNRFRIGILKKNSPVEVLINGKSDFTMTGRKQRTYFESSYLIQYVGKVESIEFLPYNEVTIERTIPDEFSQRIDLRKKYY